MRRRGLTELGKLTRGLRLWLRADRGVVREGNQIVRWQDCGPSGNHALRDGVPAGREDNPTLVVDPRCRRPMLRWDGSDAVFRFNGISNIRTFFWVFRRESSSLGSWNQRFLLGSSGGSHRYHADFHVGTHASDLLWHASLSHPGIRFGEHRMNGRHISGATATVPCVLSLLAVRTTADVLADQLSGDRGYRDGRSWHGDIAEILVYDRRLSDDEFSRVERYLLDKYGLEPDPEPTVARGERVAGTIPSNWLEQGVGSLAIHRASGRIVIGTRGGSIVTRSPASETDIKLLARVDGEVLSVAASDDGTCLFSGTRAGAIRCHSVGDGRTVWEYRQSMPVWSVAAGGDRVAFTSTSYDGWTGKRWIGLLDATRGSLDRLLEGPLEQVWQLGFTRDGRTLAAIGEDGVVRWWDTRCWAVAGEAIVGVPGWCLASHPDSRLLATGHVDGTLRVWDTERAVMLHACQVGSALTQLAFSPGGHGLAVGTSEGKVQLHSTGDWRLHAGEQVGGLEISGLSWLDEGTALVAASLDGSLVLWQAPECARRLAEVDSGRPVASSQRSIPVVSRGKGRSRQRRRALP